MASASHGQTTESNEVLKLKFRKLHKKIVDGVNPVDVINFLFQEGVICAADMRALQRIRDDPHQQCIEMLALLHTSGNKQAFVQLYLAIKEEKSLQWLVEEIDKFTDQSRVDLIKQLYVSEPTVGQVVHTLPEGQTVCGITSLAGEIYLLRPKERDEVEVYDVISYRLQRCLTVPDSKGFVDMTSCEHYHCVYISDHVIECIHRLGVQGAATRWPVNDEPWGLSVNAAHSLLVACDEVHKIKEFSSHGDLLRELILPDDVSVPSHAIQLTTGQLVVCHGGCNDPLNRVCMISADGRHIVHSHGEQRGSDTGQYDVPGRLAVDNNEFVFVADINNRRVTLLSPTLHYVRQVVSSDKLKWDPERLYLDVQRRRLYVTDNEFKDGEYTSGRVVVFSV